jgi:uncharacterized membrane protein YgcG
MIARSLLLSLGLVSLLIACGGGGGGTPTPLQHDYSGYAPGTIVAPGGASEQDLLQNVAAARTAGLTSVYVTLATKSRSYAFPAYAQFVQTTHALAVRAYGRVYVFPIASITTLVEQSTTYNISALPSVHAPHIDASIATYQKLVATNVANQFSGPNAALKLQLCPDCSEVLLSQATNQLLLRDWHRKLDPWQTSPTYVAYSRRPDSCVLVDKGRAPKGRDCTGGSSTGSSGGSGGSSNGGSSTGGTSPSPSALPTLTTSSPIVDTSNSPDPGESLPPCLECSPSPINGGCSATRPNTSVVAHTAVAKGSKTPACGGSGLTNADLIWNAAVKDYGMNTRGLYGAPYRNECVAALQKLLADAGFAQMLYSNGTVILNVSDFVNALQANGYVQTTTPVAGDIVDLSNGHVGIYEGDMGSSPGLMLSNSSTPGTFTWQDTPANQNASEGNGQITYYHHP